jgi:hypothetical protein
MCQLWVRGGDARPSRATIGIACRGWSGPTSETACAPGRHERQGFAAVVGACRAEIHFRGSRATAGRPEREAPPTKQLCTLLNLMCHEWASRATIGKVPSLGKRLALDARESVK